MYITHIYIFIGYRLCRRPLTSNAGPLSDQILWQNPVTKVIGQIRPELICMNAFSVARPYVFQELFPVELHGTSVFIDCNLFPCFL